MTVNTKINVWLYCPCNLFSESSVLLLAVNFLSQMTNIWQQIGKSWENKLALNLTTTIQPNFM